MGGQAGLGTGQAGPLWGRQVQDSCTGQEHHEHWAAVVGAHPL